MSSRREGSWIAAYNVCRITIRACLLALVLSAAVHAASDPVDIDRPGDLSKPTRVEIGLFLVNLSSIDTSDQSFTANVFLQARWSDPRLRSEKAGLRTIRLEEIWNPRLQITNRQNVNETLLHVAEVDPEGNVVYRQRYHGQFSQPLDLKDFPRDRHILSVIFVALGYTPSEVELVRDDRLGRTGLGSQHSQSEWKVGEYRARAQSFVLGGGPRALAGFVGEIEVIRQLGFYAAKIFLPLSLIVMMSWGVFWLEPKNVRSRVSVAMTSMLTVTANYFLLINFLPRISYLTRMDYLALSVLALVFASLIMVIIGTRLDQHGYEARALKLSWWCRFIFPAIFAAIVIFAMIV